MSLGNFQDPANISGTVTVDSEMPAAATIAADGITPTVPGIAGYSFIKTPGANTWDRQYPVSAAMDSTGTGIAAAGLVAQLDDASTTAVTENQFAPVRLSSRRALLVEGVASGTAQPISAASGALASGSVASGAIASGAVASGAFASGAVSSGAYASGSLASGAMVDITNVSMPITPASATATKTIGLGAEYRTTVPTWTNTQQGALQVGSRGSLHTELWNTDSATPVPSGSGNATGALRVELANNGTGLVTVNPATAANWGVYVEDAAETAGGNLMMAGSVRRDTAASSAGTTGDNATINTDSIGRLWTTGTVIEDAGHSAGESLNGIGARRIDPCANSAGSDADWGTVNQSAEGALWVTTAPTTASGLSVAMFTSSDGSTALTATSQVVKASAGNLYGYYIYNPNTSATYVHLYNTASASVTVGTTNPLITLCIPATSGANMTFPFPVSFSNAGWAIAATTTGGGNTAPSTALEAVIFYK